MAEMQGLWANLSSVPEASSPGRPRSELLQCDDFQTFPLLFKSHSEGDGKRESAGVSKHTAILSLGFLIFFICDADAWSHLAFKSFIQAGVPVGPAVVRSNKMGQKMSQDVCSLQNGCHFLSAPRSPI